MQAVARITRHLTWCCHAQYTAHAAKQCFENAHVCQCLRWSTPNPKAGRPATCITLVRCSTHHLGPNVARNSVLHADPRCMRGVHAAGAVPPNRATSNSQAQPCNAECPSTGTSTCHHHMEPAPPQSMALGCALKPLALRGGVTNNHTSQRLLSLVCSVC